MKRLEVRIKRIERSMDREFDELKSTMEEINRLMTDVYGPIPEQREIRYMAETEDESPLQVEG